MIPPNHTRRGPSRWHFDIDKHLNPFVPPSALPRMPAPVAHFLGYRTHAPAYPLGNLAMIFWAVVGVFASLAIIGAVVLAVPSFQAQGVPTIIGSFVRPASFPSFPQLDFPLSPVSLSPFLSSPLPPSSPNPSYPTPLSPSPPSPFTNPQN